MSTPPVRCLYLHEWQQDCTSVSLPLHQNDQVYCTVAHMVCFFLSCQVMWWWMLIHWTGDDFSNTASLVEAVLALQEQRDQWPLADIVQPPTSALPGASHVLSAAAEAAAEPHVSVPETDRHVDASTAAPAASYSADANGEYHYVHSDVAGYWTSWCKTLTPPSKWIRLTVRWFKKATLYTCL